MQPGMLAIRTHGHNSRKDAARAEFELRFFTAPRIKFHGCGIDHAGNPVAVQMVLYES